MRELRRAGSPPDGAVLSQGREWRSEGHGVRLLPVDGVESFFAALLSIVAGSTGICYSRGGWVLPR